MKAPASDATDYYPAATRERSQYVINIILMAVFFGAIGIIPIAWYVIGIKTYGTGDYHQP